MYNIYKNIEGDTAVQIDEGGHTAYKGRYRHLSICNVHSSNAAEVDLYLTKTITGPEEATDSKTYGGTNDERTYVGQYGNWDPLPTKTYVYYILKGTSIPAGTTLVLEEDDLYCNYREYDLYIKLKDSGDKVDIILKSDLR